MKQYVFKLVIILLVLLGMEGFAALGLKYLKKRKNIVYRPSAVEPLRDIHKDHINKILNGKEKYITHDKILGWTVKPNGKTPLYTANSQGIRSDSDYSEFPANNEIRIATFGDSFTHCDEVKNDHTWQSYLQKLNPNMEVINFGVSGYGLDQAYLRYLHHGRKYHPDIVVIGFMSENLVRNMNVFRPFYNMGTRLPLSKPRFDLSNGELKLLDNPLASLDDYQQLLDNEQETIFKLAKNDYFIRNRYKKHPWDFLNSIRLYVVLRSIYLKPTEHIFKGVSFNTDTPIYKVTESILDRFYTTIKQDGAIPVIAIIPNGGDIGRMNASQIKTYEPFLQFIKSKDYTHIDLTDYFYNEKIPDDILPTLQAPGKHFSPVGNEKLAEYIDQYIKKNKSTFNLSE